MAIMVHATPGTGTRGVLSIGSWTVRCALGRGGVRTDKREGDGATPRAALALRRVFYRADKLVRPETALPIQPIRPDDGWCDDPAHPRYNTLIRLPFRAGHERMWREDGLYDVVVELGWNDDPPIKHHGSAIFLHVARDDYMPTEGCIALKKSDVLRLVRRLEPWMSIAIV
ncbi:MAG: L,D-transpeptidase family protein [Pseudomonadota bacterium]